MRHRVSRMTMMDATRPRSDKKFENIYDLGKFLLTWWHTNVKTVEKLGPLEPLL
jgi:hypothetical protein